MHCSIVKSQTNALALIEPLILLNVFLSECCRGQLVMRSSLNENSDKTNMDQKTYDLKECLFRATADGVSVESKFEPELMKQVGRWLAAD